jgi:hypothetical protein
MSRFIPKIHKTKCPLERATNPRSFWRDTMNSMKPGHWFEYPADRHASVLAAANKYTKGRYSAYKHPEREDFYIYVRIK